MENTKRTGWVCGKDSVFHFYVEPYRKPLCEEDYYSGDFSDLQEACIDEPGNCGEYRELHTELGLE
jgi:hypothetical protein